MLGAGRHSRGPTILLKWASLTRPATISACTITMDHNAIICSMIDRLARGPDQDVPRPERGQPKVPFYACRCHIFVVDYRWGSMGSNETATATSGGPRVLAFLTGAGRHRAQIICFFRGRSARWTPPAQVW